jgi:hypothetical protein
MQIDKHFILILLKKFQTQSACLLTLSIVFQIFIILDFLNSLKQQFLERDLYKLHTLTLQEKKIKNLISPTQYVWKNLKIVQLFSDQTQRGELKIGWTTSLLYNWNSYTTTWWCSKTVINETLIDHNKHRWWWRWK